MPSEQPPTFESGANPEIVAEFERAAAEFARITAIRAGYAALKFWRSPTNPHYDPTALNQVIEKADGVGNYTTAADTAAERVIVDAIRSHPLFHEHSIVSEESDPVVADPVWQWIIDPIDGTIRFSHGGDVFGVSIGLNRGQDPRIGVIALPARGELFLAQPGQAVACQTFEGTIIETLQPAEQSSPLRLDRVLLGYDIGYHDRAKYLQMIGRLADRINYPVSYGAAAYSITAVASGTLDAYLHPNITTFDIGAAVPIITGVGGKVTTFAGEAVDWTKSSHQVLMTRDPRVHAQLLELLNE